MQKFELIFPKWLIPVEPEGQVLENYAIAVADQKIVDILPQKNATKKYPKINPLILTEHVLLPGLINAHTHHAMTLLRGLANDLPLMEWLNNYIWPTEKKWMNEEFAYDAMQLALGEMLKSGSTCFNEHYFFPESIAQATSEVGARGCIGFTIMDAETCWAKNADEALNKGMPVFHKWHHHPLINIVLGPHSPYMVEDATFLKIKKIADEYDLIIHAHVHESSDEIKLSLEKYHQRPLQRLHDLGILSSKFQCAHMVQINDEDLAIVKATKVHVIHCPESNMKLANDICPVQKFLDNGVNVALGTDSAMSNNDLDMIGEMRTAALVGKLVEHNPSHLPAAKVLTMATLNGAKALHLEDKIGSLKIGKEADMIAIDLQHLATQPVYDPIAQIIYSTSRDQVTHVWVAGKKLLINRKLTSLDEQKVLAKTKKWRDKIQLL